MDTATGTATVRRPNKSRDAWSFAAALGTAAALAGLWSPSIGAQGLGFGLGGFGSGLGLGVPDASQGPVFLPGVRASAAYSDNFDLSPRNKSGDMLLEVSPYLIARSEAPRANYNLFYQIRNFLRVGDGETKLLRQVMNGQGSFALVDDRLWLDVTGFMGNINVSPTGPLAFSPSSAFTNTGNIRRFSISPWYTDRLGNWAQYHMRYFIANSSGSGGVALAKLDQRASAKIEGLSDNGSAWNWNWHGEMQSREFEGGFTRDRRNSGATLYYNVTPALRVFGTYDYDQIDGLRNKDGDDHGYGPGAGFDWRPSARTSLGGSASHRYYGTIGDVHASYTRGMATMGVQASRSVLSGADASLLLFDPNSIASGGLGTNSGATSILSGLMSRGILLPSGIPLSQTLFTDATMLDRRVTTFLGLNTPRNSLTLSAYYSNRESTGTLSSTGTSGGIRNSSPANGEFVGELRQKGASATLQHRLDGRSAILAGLVRTRLTSSIQASDTQLTTFNLGYSTQLTSDAEAFAGFRHTTQGNSTNASTYVENVIYGGVDVRFK